MTATELIDISFDYLAVFAPYLLIFFALAFAYKVIDLIYYAVDAYRRR